MYTREKRAKNKKKELSTLPFFSRHRKLEPSPSNLAPEPQTPARKPQIPGIGAPPSPHRARTEKATLASPSDRRPTAEGKVPSGEEAVETCSPTGPPWNCCRRSSRVASARRGWRSLPASRRRRARNRRRRRP